MGNRQSNNMFISKLAYEDRVQGDLGAQNRSVLKVREDSSTKSTQQSASKVEFQLVLSATCLTKGAKLLWMALDSLEVATENSKQLELPLGLDPVILKAYDPKSLSQMLATSVPSIRRYLKELLEHKCVSWHKAKSRGKDRKLAMHIPEAGLPNMPPPKKPRKPKVVKQPEQTQLELAPQTPQEPELKALPPIELYSAQKFLKNAEFLLDQMPSILNRLDGSIPVTKAILRSRMLDPQKGVTVEELKQIMTYRTKVKEAVAAGILPADMQDVCSTFWDMYVAFQVSNHQSKTFEELDVIATTVRAYLSALLDSGEENYNERYQKVYYMTVYLGEGFSIRKTPNIRHEGMLSR